MHLPNIARNNHKLCKVHLTYEDIRDSYVIKFQEACESVEELAIVGCKMVGDEALLDSAPKLHLLKSINLSGTQITDQGLKLIAEECRHIGHVNVTDSGRVTDMGIVALVEHLGTQTNSLVVLQMWSQSSVTGI